MGLPGRDVAVEFDDLILDNSIVAKRIIEILFSAVGTVAVWRWARTTLDYSAQD